MTGTRASTGPMNPGTEPNSDSDLILLRRTEVLAERVSQLHVVEAVVAARQDEHRAALARR